MLKNYTIKAMAVVIMTFFSLLGFSQSPYSFSDDFESYNVGDYLAANSDTWTTWSGNVGGAEDAKISDTQASSATKSVYFNSTSASGGPTDLVFPMPELYELGTVVYESNIFVDQGQGGYFNFQGGAKIGDTWTIDVYFVDDGKFYVTESSNSIVDVNATYPIAEWFNLKITADLTINVWTVEINGEVLGVFSTLISSTISL